MAKYILVIVMLFVHGATIAQTDEPADTFCCCVPGDTYNPLNYERDSLPSGVVRVSSALFCDKTEVANVHWREFMYWTGKVFGLNSEEYRAILPDTLVWVENDTCLYSYAKYYLRHAAYDFYPVVGVSQQQIELFSKWRADRVFERILVLSGKLKFNSVQTRVTHFTIERYFKDELNTIISKEKLLYYPDYRLPTASERQLILTYADSVDLAYLNKGRSKKHKKQLLDYPLFWTNPVPCTNDWREDYTPTRDIYNNYFINDPEAIYNLRGNVNEWLSEPGIAAGGGWSDTRERILQNDTFHISSPNNSTGFRNVASWKKWEKK